MNVLGILSAAVLVATSCHAVAQTTSTREPSKTERSTGTDNPYLAYAAVTWDLARIDACAAAWSKGGDLAGSLELRQIRRRLAADHDVVTVMTGFRPWLLRHYGSHRIMEPAEGSSDTIRRMRDAAAAEIDRIATQNPDGMERDCEHVRAEGVAGREPTTPVRSRFPAGVADLEATTRGAGTGRLGDDRMPSDAELDALWAQRRWNDLGDILTNQRSPQARQSAMRWLDTRLQAGGGLMHGLILAKMLWEDGSRMSEHDGIRERAGDPQDQLRAATILLYTHALIEIDGRRCADATAPKVRLEQLDDGNESVPQWRVKSTNWPIRYLWEQPVSVRETAVDAAVALERQTASVRRNDDLLCRGGKDGLEAAARRGERPWIPTTRRHYDGTIGIEPPADWTPGVLTPDTYKPLQDEARAGLRNSLRAIATPPRTRSMPPIIEDFGRTFLLFFDGDSDTLTPRGRRIAQEIAISVRRPTRQNTTIRIKGYTDTHLANEPSMQLSRRRALNVGRELVRNGVDPESIRIDWFGKTHLIIPTDDGVRELQNNRVEVFP